MERNVPNETRVLCAGLSTTGLQSSLAELSLRPVAQPWYRVGASRGGAHSSWRIHRTFVYVALPPFPEYYDARDASFQLTIVDFRRTSVSATGLACRIFLQLIRRGPLWVEYRDAQEVRARCASGVLSLSTAIADAPEWNVLFALRGIVIGELPLGS